MRYTEVISVVTQKWVKPCESAAWLTAAGRCSQGLLILSRPTVRGWGEDVRATQLHRLIDKRFSAEV